MFLELNLPHIAFRSEGKSKAAQTSRVGTPRPGVAGGRIRPSPTTAELQKPRLAACTTWAGARELGLLLLWRNLRWGEFGN